MDNRLKLRAIKMAAQKRLTRQQIADRLGTARSTLQKWLAEYKRVGRDKFIKGRTCGRHNLLSPNEEELISSYVAYYRPNDIGPVSKHHRRVSTAWTWRRIQTLIEDQTSKKLSRCTIIRLLQRWGMWPQFANLALRFAEARARCSPDSKRMISPGRRRIGVAWATSYRLRKGYDAKWSDSTSEPPLRLDATLLTAIFGRGERYFAIMPYAKAELMLIKFAEMIQLDHNCRDNLYLVLPRPRKPKRATQIIKGSACLSVVEELRQMIFGPDEIGDEIDFD